MRKIKYGWVPKKQIWNELGKGHLAETITVMKSSGTLFNPSISLLRIYLYVCSCVHDTAEPLDVVAVLPDTQS